MNGSDAHEHTETSPLQHLAKRVIVLTHEMNLHDEVRIEFVIWSGLYVCEGGW